jgi:PTH1 family peptidyl-tRNA hydrolase
MKLLLGLGNYGREYAHTRHNAGWDAVTRLAKSLGAEFREQETFRAELADARVNNEKVLFCLPQTYMNRSGDAALALFQFYKLSLSDLLIVHDEMDFAMGKFAFTKSGGAAGHNGVASIQERLGTHTINRLRLGIGRPVPPLKKEDYVLQRFTADEENILQEVYPKAENALTDWVSFGIDKAMNSWNGVMKNA